LGWTVALAQEIAREQGNGRGRVGVTFVVGNHKEVLARSRPLRLDPLAGHPAHRKRLDDPGARATLKQLARLGEVFVVSEEGVALSVVRLPSVPFRDSGDPPVARDVRWGAAASISRATGAVAVVVSEDSAVRVYEGGSLVDESFPGAGPPRLSADRFSSPPHHRPR
jgi:DNA integrity scanning protein DisA with diadenylate cyclase activity